MLVVGAGVVPHGLEAGPLRDAKNLLFSELLAEELRHALDLSEWVLVEVLVAEDEESFGLGRGHGQVVGQVREVGRVGDLVLQEAVAEAQEGALKSRL